MHPEGKPLITGAPRYGREENDLETNFTHTLYTIHVKHERDSMQGAVHDYAFSGANEFLCTLFIIRALIRSFFFLFDFLPLHLLAAQIYDGMGRLVKSPPGECSCNATTILNLLKRDHDFGAAIRGAPGTSGKDGRTGAPGLTVSD